MVPIQLKILTPVGTAINMVVIAKTEVAMVSQPHGEHVVAPHGPAHHPDDDSGENYKGITKQWFS